MAEQTTNFNLTKDASTDYYNIDTTNANLDKIDKALGNTALFEKAGGTGTVITLTGIDFADGRSKTFIVSVDNNGAATTINGKRLYKPGTTAAPKLISGKAVTVWYDAAGDCFFIKASATGSASPEDVLADVPFSNEEGEQVGTMPNHGPATAETITLTAEGAEYTIPKGFHSGLRKIKAVISGLIASVIKAGVTVGGVSGTFTADATATADKILAGETAYVDSEKIIGNIPVITSQQTAVTVGADAGGNIYLQPPMGYYSGQTVKANDPDFVSPNIKAGVNIFGISGKSSVVETSDANAVAADLLSGKNAYVNGAKIHGAMGNNGAVSKTLAVNETYTIPAGYHNGSGKVTQSLATKGAATYTPTTSDQIIAANQYLTGVQTIKGDANLTADNIRSGKSIFGLTGTLQEGLKFATGEAYATNNGHTFKDVTNTSFGSGFFYSLNVSGLTFKPDIILCLKKGFGDTVWSYDTIYRKNPSNAGYGTIVAKAGSSQYKMLHDSDLTSVTTDAYVNSSGFRLPVDVNGSAYPFIWIALSLAGKVNLY